MSITYYTIKGKTDGFGAQYQAILSGIAYCNYEKYVYVHTPIKQMEHNVDVSKANEFIGINTTHNDICKIEEQPFSESVHFSETPSIYYTDKVLKYIRECYYSTEKPSIGLIDIAIHIRRGDVNKNKNQNRYTDNSYYREIIKN